MYIELNFVRSTVATLRAPMRVLILQYNVLNRRRRAVIFSRSFTSLFFYLFNFIFFFQIKLWGSFTTLYSQVNLRLMVRLLFLMFTFSNLEVSNRVHVRWLYLTVHEQFILTLITLDINTNHITSGCPGMRASVYSLIEEVCVTVAVFLYWTHSD